MKKAEGYTLIELVVSIFIILSIASCGVKFYGTAKSIKNSIQIKKYTYEIQNLLSYGKSICREKKKTGKIVLDNKTNTIRFIEGHDSIEKTVTVPKEYKIFPYFRYYILEDGRINGSNTINIMDEKNICHEITIKTGVDTITIKEEENEET